MKNCTYPQDKNSIRLYKAGAVTALLFLVYSVITLLIFALIGEGYPQTALECFTMLKDDLFVGLLRLDIVSVVFIPFYYILFFSLYRSLRDTDELAAAIAIFSILAGVTIFISDVNIAELLTLSKKYHAASTPEFQQQILAAGEAVLASDMWISTSAKIRGIMIEFGALTLSLLMLKTDFFKRYTAITGILAHGFDLTSEIFSIFIPTVKEIFTMIAGPLYIVWFVLIAIGL